MSGETKEREKHGLFGSFLFPYKFRFEVEKCGEPDLYKMVYVEWIAAKDKEVFKRASETTIKFLKQMGLQAKVKGNTFKMELTAPFEAIASMMLTELLAQSRIGDLTLRDMIVMTSVVLTPQRLSKVGIKQQ